MRMYECMRRPLTAHSLDDSPDDSLDDSLDDWLDDSQTISQIVFIPPTTTHPSWPLTSSLILPDNSWTCRRGGKWYRRWRFWRLRCPPSPELLFRLWRQRRGWRPTGRPAPTSKTPSWCRACEQDRYWYLFLVERSVVRGRRKREEKKKEDEEKH